MPVLDADFDDGAINAAVAELRDALDDEAAQGVGDCVQIVALAAQQQHPYTNRTGVLEAMTLPGEVRGTLSEGTLQGEVVGMTDYASFLEDNPTWKFIEPANQRTQGAQSRSLDDRLRAAVRRTRAWK